MSDACCAFPEWSERSDTEGACPGCGRRGRPVGLATVKTLVAISLRELVQTPYQFCNTPDCAVVYYAASVAPSAEAPARGAITRDQLRERVFQKEPDPDVLVCYCFRHTLGAIQQGNELARAAILADIAEGTRRGLCACTLRNPQGGCCLGNVQRLMRGVALIIDSQPKEPA
jgi:hypothetical protein